MNYASLDYEAAPVTPPGPPTHESYGKDNKGDLEGQAEVTAAADLESETMTSLR